MAEKYCHVKLHFGSVLEFVASGASVARTRRLSAALLDQPSLHHHENLQESVAGQWLAADNVVVIVDDWCFASSVDLSQDEAEVKHHPDWAA